MIWARQSLAVGRVSAAVAGERGAIGIMGLRSPVAALSRPLAIGRGGEALLPTRINVQSEDYPLVQRYSLYGGQMMSALGRSFALFAVGRRAQETVAAFMRRVARIEIELSALMHGRRVDLRTAGAVVVRDGAAGAVPPAEGASSGSA